jgi:CubicO group peptidase (beta-lactamase class C family)
MVDGRVEPGFEGVGTAFERCFTELGETGASVAAMVHGQVVVDLWGGAGFNSDSLVNVYSVTKPMAALCVLVLVERGTLRLEDPMARYWPEFGHAGKQRVTIREALSHQAGLPALRARQPAQALFDWDRMCAAIAAEEPFFEPGTAHAEHAFLYGHLCGELIRRTDGRSLGAFWREEVAAPWRLDFHIGLTDAEQGRVIDLTGEIPAFGGELYQLAVSNPPGPTDLSVVNSRAWRAAEIPAVNGHGTARGVSRFYQALLNGGELDGARLVSPTIVAAMSAGELTARDLLLEEDDVTWGLGVRAWGPDDGYGMGGLGGSLGLADPSHGLALAYVTRQMGTHERFDSIETAIRAALTTA